MSKKVVEFIRSIYPEEFVPLHAPCFIGREKEYLNECIDSTFVSSVGKFVDQFESMLCDYTGSKNVVAVTNGTAALHMALILSDVQKEDEVLTQALTFVATANAITYTGATPIFLDSSDDNLALCPTDLASFLNDNAQLKDDGFCYNKKTNRRIKACIPMHTFGHPAKMDEIIDICKQYNISIIEDAAESIGSKYKGKQTGIIAPIGIMSFNGNKTITSGGGGALLIQNDELAKRAKFLTTTAKRPHKWEFFHEEVAYNYRMPNINAALLCAQLENLPKFLEDKKNTAQLYRAFFKESEIHFCDTPKNCSSSFWLNAIQLKNKDQRDEFLESTNSAGVMTRPIWRLMSDLPAFEHCQRSELKNARYYEERVVNIPSSVRLRNE